MRAEFQFTYEASELDLGKTCLVGDFLITLATDDLGFSFRVVDVDGDGAGVCPKEFAYVRKWVDTDTAPRARGSDHKSLVREAYTDALIERDENRAEDRGCHEYHQMRGAA